MTKKREPNSLFFLASKLNYYILGNLLCIVYIKAFQGGSIGKASILLIGILRVRVPRGEEGQSQMHAISNPLSPGNRGLRVVLSGHFCASLHAGHARRTRPILNYRIVTINFFSVKFFCLYHKVEICCYLFFYFKESKKD